jgi:AcrR family transcriptional regulator
MTDQLAPRVEQACQQLLAAGTEVTFPEVAARVGVGRATLYRRPELRAIVEEHRQRGREAFTLTGLAVQIDQLRSTLDALAAKIRRHEEELRQLRLRPARETPITINQPEPMQPSPSSD